MPLLAKAPRSSAETELPVATLVNGYLDALDVVVESGFGYEIDWQEQCRLEELTEATFLRETAWVILSSGMSTRAVCARFPSISTAFLGWESAERIVRARERCRRRALRVFRHPAKIDAIGSVAAFVARATFAEVQSQINKRGVDALATLPFIGPITKFHLAKNLGIDVAKPDRHLVRLALSAGVSSPDQLCKVISAATGDRVATVDLVFWRYATINRGYANLFVRSHVPESS